MLNGTSTEKGQFVPTAGRGKPAQLDNDGQQDTMHTILRFRGIEEVILSLE